MEEWIERIRKNLSEGYKGIMISFFVTSLLIYNLTWAILEPSGYQNHIINFSKNWKLESWWIHLFASLILSLIINVIIYRFLRTYLSRLSLEVGDVNVKDCWNNTEKQSSRTIVNDGYLGSVVQFSGDQDYAIDYDVLPIAFNSKSIEYVVKPQNDFVIYLRIKIASANNSVQQQSKWIALKMDSSGATPLGRGVQEWNFPAKPHVMSGGWIRYSVKINEAVNKTFGLQGWKYSSLIALRIRGTASIETITLK